MEYKKIVTKGKLIRVCEPIEFRIGEDCDLISPDKLMTTLVRIVQDNGKEEITAVAGIVPDNCTGKEVKLLQKGFRFSHRYYIVDEFYVEGKRIINQPYIMDTRHRP